MLGVSAGWLPRSDPAYRLITPFLLPFALALLLLDVHVPTVWRVGWRALAAMGAGALSIAVATPLIAWLWRTQLPPEAWKGVGALTATWTGGSMNLLAVRTIVETPEVIFTALIVTDALIAYSWMAMLVALSSRQAVIDRWLRAESSLAMETPATDSSSPNAGRAKVLGMVIAAGVVGAALLVSRWCPSIPLIPSRSGWVIVLVTTFSLITASFHAVRRVSHGATAMGYPCLYLVLAAMGAQASLTNLLAAPAWLGIGVGVALVHGATLLLIGRWMRLPLALLATASQANFGGVVSAPLVGALYHEQLAPVGLCLALLGNAVGTYVGLWSASLAHRLLP